MNVVQLKEHLAKLGINDKAWSINTDLPERFVLLSDVMGWIVFYSEKGARNEERLFATENEACEHLIDLLSSDPTTFIDG